MKIQGGVLVNRVRGADVTDQLSDTSIEAHQHKIVEEKPLQSRSVLVLINGLWNSESAPKSILIKNV